MRSYKVPASCSAWLLTDLLRGAWGFQGQVVSDCGAISNITRQHHYAATVEEADADAVRAGCDLECGTDYRALTSAVSQGLDHREGDRRGFASQSEGAFRAGPLRPAGTGALFEDHDGRGGESGASRTGHPARPRRHRAPQERPPHPAARPREAQAAGGHRWERGFRAGAARGPLVPGQALAPGDDPPGDQGGPGSRAWKSLRPKAARSP